jgi:hypothetical protein
VREPLLVGRIYIVRGQGYMLLAELPKPPKKTTVTMRAHGNMSYWAAPEDILGRASAAFINENTAQARARGLECTDPECWCRRAKDAAIQGKDPDDSPYMDNAERIEPTAAEIAAGLLEAAHNDVADAAAQVVSFAVDVPARGVATVPLGEMHALRDSVRRWRDASERLVRITRGDAPDPDPVIARYRKGGG